MWENMTNADFAAASTEFWLSDSEQCLFEDESEEVIKSEATILQIVN